MSCCCVFQKVRYCTAGRALKVSLCMVVGCLLVGVMQLYLWTYDPASQLCTVRRSATKGGSASLFSIWSWVTEMIMFLVVPLIILVVNIVVMREVFVFHSLLFSGCLLLGDSVAQWLASCLAIG